MMTPQEAQNLLDRYVAHKCTEQEENLVNSWYNKIVRETDYPDNFSMNPHAMSDDWNRLTAAMQKAASGPRHKIYHIGRAIAAAVAAAAMITGALIYNKPSGKETRIALSATLLDTTINHRDKDFRTTLPDGTIVYLNGASSLRYAKGLKGKQREVFLEGEAYFEVSPDKDRPFIVNSREQKVQVLGTHFNVSSYGGEPVKTTLLEGAVKLISTGNKDKEVILKPGDQATLGIEGFEVKKVDTDSAIAWKEIFVFDQTPLKNVLKQLGRWYHVDVDSSKIPAVNVDAIYGKNTTLPTLIQEITQSTGVKLIVDNNIITVL